MKKNKKLDSRILYLPLDLHEKVLLWLAYRGLKPVSEITVERRGNLRSLLKRGIRRLSTYHYNSMKSRRIRKWLKDAGMFRVSEPKYESSWHIGRDKTKVILSARILHDFGYENEYQSGIMFGFPEESAKAYAHNRVSDESNQIPMINGELYTDLYLRDKYYTPYIFYNMPKDRIVEDSKVAKKWADTIREEVPTLAKWFEKHEAEKRLKSLKD